MAVIALLACCVTGVSFGADKPEKLKSSIANPAVVTLGSLFPADSDAKVREVSAAYALNNRGQIVGRARVSAESSNETVHAFLWEKGRMRDLGTLPGYEEGSVAVAINDAGQIAGISGGVPYEDLKHTHAFLCDKGKMTDLGTLGGDYSEAVAIDKSGRIAGISTTASGEMHGFICEKDRMRDMGVCKGYKYYRVEGMNDIGEIVGAMSVDSDRDGEHAFFYKDGVFHDLGVFGGRSSEAHAVNNAGEIVGEFSMEKDGRGMHAFLISGGKMRDLTGTVNTRDSLGAVATCINDRGEIAIMVPADDHSTRNSIYRKGKAVDFKALVNVVSGYSVQSVAAINNSGGILCFGFTPDGDASFLLRIQP